MSHRIEDSDGCCFCVSRILQGRHARSAAPGRVAATTDAKAASMLSSAKRVPERALFTTYSGTPASSPLRTP
jgi:hypothetical protein